MVCMSIAESFFSKSIHFNSPYLLTSGLPINLESWKNLEFDNFGQKKLRKPWNLRKFEKSLEFEHKSLKNLEKLGILTTLLVKK